MQSRRTELRAASAALPAPRDLLALPRQRFDMVAGRLEHGLRMNTQIHRNSLTAVASGLRPITLERQVAQGRERLQALQGRAVAAFSNKVQQQRLRLSNSAGLLSSLSYERVIERGYAVVRDESGIPLASAQAVQAGQALRLEMKGGTVGAVADDDGVTPTPPREMKTAAGPAPETVATSPLASTLEEHVAQTKAKQAKKPTRKKRIDVDPDAQGNLF